MDAALRLDPNDRTVVGVHIVELPTGQTVYSSNADRPLKPASNMKLLTTAAAISLLGRDFAFETRCVLAGEDLIVIGAGDPTPGHPRAPPAAEGDPFEMFYSWADELRTLGITTIPGDLIVDDRAFDTRWTNPTWPGDQLHKHYCAPVGGLNLHGNCVTARLIPGDTAGELVRYLLIPTNPWIRVDNRCKTGSRAQPWMSPSGDGRGYVLGGRCANQTTLGLVTVPDPGMFFGTTLRTYLGAKGIRVQGLVRRPNPGEQTPPVSSLDRRGYELSPLVTPLSEVLKRANTESINLAAEALLKTMGRAYGADGSSQAPPGSWDLGREAVRAFLAENGLDHPRLVLADGSGLSHDNRVTPLLVADLLTMMFNGPDRDLYINSLARSGLDGTLTKRMKDMPGRFRGKTGYIDGVRTLSGYLRTDHGTWLAVSIMHNGFTGPSARYRDAQDQVCRLLASYP